MDTKKHVCFQTVLIATILCGKRAFSRLKSTTYCSVFLFCARKSFCPQAFFDRNPLQPLYVCEKRGLVWPLYGCTCPRFSLSGADFARIFIPNLFPIVKVGIHFTLLTPRCSIKGWTRMNKPLRSREGIIRKPSRSSMNGSRRKAIVLNISPVSVGLRVLNARLVERSRLARRREELLDAMPAEGKRLPRRERYSRGRENRSGCGFKLCGTSQILSRALAHWSCSGLWALGAIKPHGVGFIR